MESVFNYLKQLGAICPVVNKDHEIPVIPHDKSPYFKNRLPVAPRRSILRRHVVFPQYKIGSSRLNSASELHNAILKETNEEIHNFITEFLDLNKYYQSILFNTKEKVYIEEVDFDSLRAVVNISLVNSIPDLNSYFSSIYRLLPDAGIFIGRFEGYNTRIKRFKAKYGRFFGGIRSIADFIINRVLPKVRPLNKLYNYLTKDKFNVLSKAEVLGRLVFSGFDIIECKQIDGLWYVVGMKTLKQKSVFKKGSYYPLFKMQRIGKGGKMIGVYKFRTMHPYSEFIQDYVIKLHGYNEKGKPANDFRLTPWGKWMRRLWLDELPQLINLVKGEMKLMGVRPLSNSRFFSLPIEVQESRIKHKPGCFPPYVALCMPDEKENIEAEIIYMKEKEKRPYTTDIKYLFLAVYNILTNKIRSG